jgi:uncharacterized repeat protein (TIGR01451 family)
VIAPDGVQATFIQGHDVRGFETPVNVGLRPGYLYRFRLSNLEHYPRLSLWPTLEVIGTLTMPCCPADHPAPVVFTQEDIDHAMAGALITKVIYLEDPEKALAVQSDSDRPLESEERPDRDPYTEAFRRGRPLLIVRFGGRQADPQEVACAAIPGTVLLPGDHGLGPPAAPPYLPFKCMQAYDPIHGPKLPEEECMHDGGDVGLRATIIRGELHGLDPSDTVAEYTDNKGERRLTISNRICLCVPRFAVLRTEIAPVDYSAVHGPQVSIGPLPPYDIHAQVPPKIEANAQPPALAVMRQKPSQVKEVEGPVIIDTMETPALVIGVQEARVVVGTLKQVCVAPAVPLKLCKSADKKCAQIGDVVTFKLTYKNPGGQPITDVVVSDSLTARLEYVPGTEKSDRDAVFTTQANEVGSSIVRWQVKTPLLPGESGTVTFQVRIR